MLHYAGNLTAIRKAIREGAEFLESNTLRSRKETSNDDGTVTLRAKAVDRFQFVMRPTVTVDPERHTIVSCDCDCEKGRNGLCCHVVALLLSIGEQIEPAPPAQAAPVQSAVRAESGPDEITIRVVHEGEAVRTAASDPAPIPGEPRLKSAPGKDDPEPPAPKPEPEPVRDEPETPAPEPEPEPVFTPPGIQVLFGHRHEDEAEVFWTPNDTEQILHPNMGVIGTMGLGRRLLALADHADGDFLRPEVRRRPDFFGGG